MTVCRKTEDPPFGAVPPVATLATRVYVEGALTVVPADCEVSTKTWAFACVPEGRLTVSMVVPVSPVAVVSPTNVIAGRTVSCSIGVPLTP